MSKINHEPDSKYQTHTQLDLSNQNRSFYYSRTQSYQCSEVSPVEDSNSFTEQKNSRSTVQVLIQTHTEGFYLASIKYSPLSSVNTKTFSHLSKTGEA